MEASTEKRRNVAGQNIRVIVHRTYADDWLVLTNGGKAEAVQLRDEFQAFLFEHLKLELSVEKTHVTHVNSGFDFLGWRGAIDAKASKPSALSHQTVRQQR